MSIESTVFPSELLVAPQPLIGFCGLDVNRNTVHKSIWDAFSNNRKADRAAVQFKLLPNNYDFPVAKPKRNSYEWYHPKGILKRNWMLKHLHVLPAVVVLFQDMDWNDVQWTEKQMQCAATIQSLKNSLQERNTRICLVLLQKAAPLPPGEDMLASERAASLTTACGLNSKMLFILPHTEHLMGYALRLESAFLDMALSYYTLMAKRIRSHRDQLTAAHVTLKVRHQFKLGFLSEMRQDVTTAIKHYTQSYTTLDEIHINDGNCLEIKTVSGFLNFKICRIMFKLKLSRESVNNFISHIEKYKNRVGNPELIFEHYAWLSKQHSVFAELFCEAIKSGLPSLQGQHPGIYFHKAAEYMQKRREAFVQCNVILNPTEPQNNFNSQLNSISSLYTEYFGVISSTSAEPINEQQVSMMIRENEKLFNHSTAIINLLSSAMTQFKIYKCLRFRKKLAIDMADEYVKCGDHSKAITLYSLMLPDYRNDKWPCLFLDVLLKTMRCALVSASVTDFISCSLEALSLKINCSQQEKAIVYENMCKVLEGQPIVEQNSSPTNYALWEEALSSIKSPLQIDADNLTELIEFCTTFEKFELKNDDIIKLNLIMRLQADFPLKIRNLHIIITDGSNNYKLQATQYTKLNNLLELREHFKDDSRDSQLSLQQFEENFILEPTFYYRFLFTTEAQQFLENTQLHVVRIEAAIGSEKLSVLLCKSSQFLMKAFRYYNRVRDLDDNIIINPICYITPTFHLVTQCNLNSETMLVNEFYPVTMTISNPYNVFLTGIALTISVPNSLQNKVFLTTDISANKQKLHSSIQIDIGELSMQSSNIASFYVFSLIESNITLDQKICYTTDVLKPKVTTAIVVNDSTSPNSTDESPEATLAAKNITSNQTILTSMPILTTPIHLEFLDENSLRKTQEIEISLHCESEFKFEGQFYTLNRMPLTKIYRGENFLFRAGVLVQADVALDILETYFICDHNLVQSTYSFKRKKFTNSYNRGEKLEDVIVLRTNNTSEEWLNIKDYDRIKNDVQPNIFNRLRTSRKHSLKTDSTNPNLLNSNHLNKSLVGKLSTNMTIINNTASSNVLMVSSQNSNMSSSTLSDDGKSGTNLATSFINNNNNNTIDENMALAPKQNVHTRLIYNKALDAIQATGHLRGFLKGSLLLDSTANQHSQSTPPLGNQIIFGFYCIKWRRSGCKEENESKFLITGLPIVEPPLNIYCTIEEKMFVKMPMAFKVVLKNPTSKVVHLIATLSISNTDNFICSGHKQLDISIFAFGEKELVYNLYPLYVGWQNLPELTLAYNTQADPSKDETQSNLLSELVQRAIPKKVFVLPPLKQQNK